MLTPLAPVEARILGALVEKQLTTPEYYPLTLNAIVQACNQKSNRDPVTAYDEATIARALEGLRDRNLVYIFYASGSRVPKYKHMMPEVYETDAAELALVVVLMLRGAQTIGELRERASRLHEFSDLAAVDETLRGLVEREPDPLVTRSPRQAGHKESRYAHLLSGAITIDAVDATERAEPRASSSRQAEPDRIERLERRVETLAAELEEMRGRFEEFKNQFG